MPATTSQGEPVDPDTGSEFTSDGDAIEVGGTATDTPAGRAAAARAAAAAAEAETATAAAGGPEPAPLGDTGTVTGAPARKGSNAASPSIRSSGAKAAAAAAAVRPKESGRATPKAGAPRAAPAGRYTPPIPRQQRHSPRWFPLVILVLLVLGLLTIVLNYVNVLPGGTSNYYLVGGIVAIIAGLFMATFYH